MKVAIVTQYYKSKNYGGNLQAYAMCKAVEKYGYEAEQLCFPLKTYKLGAFPVKKGKKVLEEIKIAIHILGYRILTFRRGRIARRLIKKREQSVLSFNQNLIPHSAEVYNELDMKASTEKYGVFITGSDMVWSPDLFSPIFTLDFVPSCTPKFSYAPSMGTTALTDNIRETFREFLKDYQAVSVRESGSVSALTDLAPVPVEWVLDPTLILDRTEWDAISSTALIDKPYLFCYFLGSNSDSRKAAQAYAKKHNLTLVTIPYLRDAYRSCDWKFGDIQLSDVSPSDFISLIRYSAAVFTDSFHACVFSFLYQREMFAFRRNENDKWGVRICSFLKLIGYPLRYCDTDEKECMQYIESLPKIDYHAPFADIEMMKKKSLDYLEKNLKKAEQIIRHQEKEMIKNHEK